MTSEQQAAYVIAQASAMTAEMEGMKAQNQICISQGYTIVYDAQAFLTSLISMILGATAYSCFFKTNKEDNMGRSRINNGTVRREVRQAAAAERKECSDKQSPQNRLATLDKRLGDDVGAEKERARLQKKIDGAPQQKKGEDNEKVESTTTT